MMVKTLLPATLLHRQWPAALSTRRLRPAAFLSTGNNDQELANTVAAATTRPSAERLDWDNRIALQERWTNRQKGWNVDVEWRQATDHGVGLFAVENIVKNTVLRVGRVGVNLLQFHHVQDIQAFCRHGNEDEEEEMRLRYVKDYLWGFNRYHADENGYTVHKNNNNVDNHDEEDDRFYGMWIPGNGLNHRSQPNTVYQWVPPQQHGDLGGINLVALQDIEKDQELFDDYRRHGLAPEWLLEFAEHYQVTLNFANCNDFVIDNNDDE